MGDLYRDFMKSLAPFSTAFSWRILLLEAWAVCSWLGGNLSACPGPGRGGQWGHIQQGLDTRGVRQGSALRQVLFYEESLRKLGMIFFGEETQGSLPAFYNSLEVGCSLIGSGLDFSINN